MRSLTASRAPLLEHCTWWLRDEAQHTESPSSAAARIGSCVGKAAETYVDTSSVDFQALLKSYDLTGKDALKATDGWRHIRDKFISTPIGTSHTEHAYGWNWRTDAAASYGKLESARAYPNMGPDWINGSIDLRYDKRLVDLKYTRHVHIYEKQIAVLAMLVAEHEDINEAGIWHIDQKHGVTEHMHPVDLFDHANTKAWLRKRLAVVDSDGPRKGPWCTDRYCSAKQHCPAWAEAT